MYELKSSVSLLADGKYEIYVTLDDENKRAEICECIKLIMSGQLRKNIEKNDDEVRGLKQGNDRLKADNVKLSALVIKLKDDNDKLKADNERLKNANTNISEMYWEQMNKNIEQKKKIEELEEKHWDECRQIAQYDDESKKKNELIRTVGKLLIQIANNELSIEIKDEVSDANNSEPPEPKNKATNYDKIKKMSVEEMAEFFNHVFESCSANCEECQLGIQAACTKITIGNWLKKEYTGDRTSEVSE